MNETENKRKKRFSVILKENLQKIIIVIVSIIYIVQGVFQLAEKDASVLDILGSVGLSIVVGIIISSSLSSMGLKDGRNSEIFQRSMKAYGESKEKATPNFDKLSAWCEYKNSQELEIRKKEIIQTAGLNWRAYKFGYYDEPENCNKLNDKQKQSIEKAKHCKILKIDANELLSDLPKTKYGLFSKYIGKFGESEQDYKRRNNVTEFLTKIVISVVCGLYTLAPLINEQNKLQVLAGVLWNAMQIIIWLSFGIMKYVNAKSFMEDEYRQTHIIQKTEYLNEFVITLNNNPSVIENYDENIEIDKYIQEYIEKHEQNDNAKEIKNESKEDEQKTILG